MATTKGRRVPRTRKGDHDKTVPAQATTEPQTEDEPTKGKNFIQPAVLKHVRGDAGNPVMLDDLVKLLNVSKGAVQHAANQLSKTVPQFEVVTRGQVWRWNAKVTDLSRTEAAAPASAVPAMSGAEAGEVWYLEVGQDGEGNSIVRQEGDPKLYRVMPL